MTILSFLITIGVLVIVHEFGHYIVARAFKVKVITFSIGFGPKIFNFAGKHNNWTISLIPLGGYVRMLDEREGDVHDGYKHLAFNRKAPWKKILIALAGPVFNILFAIIVYYAVALNGVSNLKPIVASVNPQFQIAEAKLFKPDMQISSVNGSPVTSWNEVDLLFHKAVKKNSIVKLGINNVESELILNLAKLRQNYNKNMYLETLGVYPYSFLPIISYVEPNSPAYKAGIKIDDTIIAINELPTNNWFYISYIIRQSVDKNITLKIKRDKEEQIIKIRPVLENNDGELYGKVGIMPTLDETQLAKNSYTQKYGILNGWAYAVNSCYSIIAINISFLGEMISGKMSLTNLGGPISIAKAGKNALHDGFKKFVDFLALISLGLAIMNLLPIPVLDGGHIVIYLVEWVTKKEVSYKTQMMIFKLGFVFIISLSVFAIYNDILRL